MKKLIFRGPVMTASGYGVHARMLLRALIESGKFDITVVSVPWGATPLIYERDEFLQKVEELSRKFDPAVSADSYDISVQVTIPNEFGRLARFNIGITAGIEVDRVSPEWISKTNDCIDLLVVPSMHSATTFRDTSYSTPDGKILSLQRPIHVLPEWVDVDVFNNLIENVAEDTKIAEKNGWNFPSSFNFLSVGLGLERGEGEDRKNFSKLIRWFCEQFAGRDDVGLVLKLSMVNHSVVDFENTKNRVAAIKNSTGCGKFPRVHIVHGRLSDREMAALYRHRSIKSFITLTHGEGYGLPIIEAAACGLPIIATNWSGHLDFLKIGGATKFVPVDFEMKEIPPSVVWKGVMDQGSRWAEVIERDAKAKMAKIIASYSVPKQWSIELAEHVIKTFNRSIGQKFAEITDEIVNHKVRGLEPKRTNQFVTQFMNFVADRRVYYKGGMQKKSLIYIMPESAGDVYVSTGVVNSLKKKFPDHLIYFAVRPQFSDILRGNPDIFAVIHYEDWMHDTRLLEFIFDEVFTPNFPVQNQSNNWIMNGRGRRLAEQFANHCLVELGEYHIELDVPTESLPEKYIAFSPGAGSGKWSARNYKHWQTVIDNLLSNNPNLPIVQIGTAQEPLYRGVIDFRGKTKSFNELAYVISKADLSVGIDSLPMHLAAGLGTKHLAIFGSSHAGSTGPSKSKALSVLVETDNRYTCSKACYLQECLVDQSNPCVNEIPPRQIFELVNGMIRGDIV